MRIAVYPGSFDPITTGHVDLIRRSLRLFDRLVIGVGHNSQKTSLFPLAERVEIIKETFSESFTKEEVERMDVQSFEGLLIDFAKSVGAAFIVRGLRAVSDFEYEFKMATMHAHLNAHLETVFLTASENQHFVSSSLIREVFRLGGDVSHFVSESTLQRMRNLLGKTEK